MTLHGTWQDAVLGVVHACTWGHSDLALMHRLHVLQDTLCALYLKRVQ